MYATNGLDTPYFIKGRNVMEVKRIVMWAAKTLGIDAGVKAYFEKGDEEMQKEAELLLHCFNLVEWELSLNYLPITAEDALHTVTGRIDFDMLSYIPVRILGVKDEHGKTLEYELFPTYLKAKPGVLLITYTYTPNEKGISDYSDFSSVITEYVLIYGVLTEYCLAQGMLEEAAVWNKKYKKAIDSAFGVRSGKRMASRRWV